MKKKTFTAIVIFVSLLPLAYLAIIWNSLPQIVPVHYGIDGKPDRMGSKWVLAGAIVIITLVSLFIYFIFKNIHKIDPRRKEMPPSAVFIKLAVGIAVFLTAISFLILNSVKSGDISSPGFLFPVIGLLFAFTGNYMINIKPNHFAGFRVSWTLNDNNNWRKTHQLGSKIWFAGGMLIAVVCLFLPFKMAFIFFLLIMIIMILVPLIYSYRLFKNTQVKG